MHCMKHVQFGPNRTGPKKNAWEDYHTRLTHYLFNYKNTVNTLQIPLTVWNFQYHEYYNTYSHIIDYRLPWTCTHWTFYPAVTGIPIYIYFTRFQQMSKFANFYYSWIATHTRLSHINSQYNPLKFISTYTFFVSIVFLIKTGECYSTRLRFQYAIFHLENIKRDPLKHFLPKVSCYFCTLFLSN